MEPVTTVFTAIAAGAAAAAKETASTAVKDAYNGLKSLIQRLFSDKKDAKGEMALTEYEGDPDTWEKPLTKALTESNADKSPDIVAAVKELQQALENMPGGPEVMAKYNFKDCEIGVAGDHTNIGTLIVGGKK